MIQVVKSTNSGIQIFIKHHHKFCLTTWISQNMIHAFKGIPLFGFGLPKLGYVEGSLNDQVVYTELNSTYSVVRSVPQPFKLVFPLFRFSLIRRCDSRSSFFI